MKIGIAGAGFAGVAAALTSAKEGAEVTLFSEERVTPYFRPRLPAIAFGQTEPEEIFMHPIEWYRDNGIELKLDSIVSAISPDEKSLSVNGENFKFDALVIATGAVPILPPFARECVSESVIPLWNYDNALRIKSKMRPGARLAIVGGGVIGVEAALRATYSDLEVTVIEKAPKLMMRNFGDTASDIIAKQLSDHGISVMTGQTVGALKSNDDIISIEMDGDQVIETDIAVLSLGAAFNTKMFADAGLKSDRKIFVDKNLKSSADSIFVAGDMAQFPQLTPCSAKEALFQGRVAGFNAVASSRGDELKSYDFKPIALQFKYKDFEIYSIGGFPSDNLREDILEFEEGRLYRSCVYDGGKIPTGAQMVGSGKDFRKYEKEILEAFECGE